MERGHFDALFALGVTGCDIIWGIIQREREAWARERTLLVEKSERVAETLERERTLLMKTLERERTLLVETLERERALLMKTQAMIEEREATAVAVLLQHKLDVAHGHVTVRSVLEQIGKSAFPAMNATDAINHVCDDAKFGAYLDVVSSVSHLSKRDLLKSAKAAYSALSSTLHSGSTITKASDVVPKDVMHDKLMLHAVAALFKYARRDVRFYLDIPANELKLPLPARTPPSLSGSSAAPSPP